MAVAVAELISPQEYLELERASSIKHEYIAGRMVEMVGATKNHNRIVNNLIFILMGQLRQRAGIVYATDMRVRIPKTNLYTYPDIAVVLGDDIFEDDRQDVLLNPTAIIEVLSPSTENYDRGDKFHSYRTIATLQEYLMIAQDTHRVEHYVRQPDDQWLFSEATELAASIHLPSIDCELPLTDVYDKVHIVTPSDSHLVNGLQG